MLTIHAFFTIKAADGAAWTTLSPNGEAKRVRASSWRMLCADGRADGVEVRMDAGREHRLCHSDRWIIGSSVRGGEICESLKIY